MIHLDNTTDTFLHVELLEKITQTLTHKDIELLILSSKDMQEINLAQRNIDKTTDVLSFPLEEMPYAPLGSILINAELSNAKAQEYAHSIEEEITLLYIHGLLHLLGYDHEKDSGEMREKEKSLIEAFGLPQSLIVRVED